MAAALKCVRKYVTRCKPPASFALSNSRKSAALAATMTGWLLSTKSCVVAPGVKFSPSTPERLDRHPADVLLAVRRRRGVGEADPGRVGARRREQADAQIGREIVHDGELGRHAPGGASLVESLNHAGRIALDAGVLEKRDEVGDDRGFVRQDGFFAKRRCGCSFRKAASYTNGGGVKTDMICSIIASRFGNRVTS